MTRLLEGDCRVTLATLPAQSVHVAVTSPPYWAQRVYDGAQSGMIGNEPTPQAWCDALVDVFRAVRRVLRDDGVLFLNVGDKYAGSGAKGTGPEPSRIKDLNSKQATNAASDGVPRPPPAGYRPKSLLGLPWMLAFAMMRDGWILRQEIIWHKLSPMPESATDRPTRAHEQVFLFSKEPHYFWDAEAVREANTEGAIERFGKDSRIAISNRKAAGLDGENGAAAGTRMPEWDGSGRNARSVQAFAPSRFSVKRLGKYAAIPDVDHFAVFPVSLPLWCIKAGTSEKGVCPECGAPCVREVKREAPPDLGRGEQGWTKGTAGGMGNPQRDCKGKGGLHPQPVQTLGWAASCAHGGELVPATVLDPFSGAGTTGLAAHRLGRNYIGCELSPAYIELTRARLTEDAPMLTAPDAS